MIDTDRLGGRVEGLPAVLLFTFIAFLIASNIAWLNPRPDFEIYRTIDEYPFMWQYNADAGMEIISAAYFPEGFRTYPQRVNRPLYPATVWLVGNAIGVVASPLVELSPLERAGAGYIVVKILVHIGVGLVLVDLLRRRLSARATLLALGFVFLHRHSIAHIATFHTTELQVLVPIVVLWLLVRLGEIESRVGRNRKYWYTLVVYSLATSILMMGKQNFAIYAAILVWALSIRRGREVLVSLTVFIIPVLLYAGYLHFMGLSYRNNEIASMGQGVWVFELFRNNPVFIWQTLWDLVLRFIENGVRFWGIAFLGALLALGNREVPLNRRELWLLFLFVGATWAQYVAVRRFEVPYMVGDLSIFVYGLFAWIVVDHWGFRNRRAVVGIISIFGFVSVLSFVHLPWLSPWEQPYRDQQYLEQRRETVESRAEEQQ